MQWLRGMNNGGHKELRPSTEPSRGCYCSYGGGDGDGGPDASVLAGCPRDRRVRVDSKPVIWKQG